MHPACRTWRKPRPDSFIHFSSPKVLFTLIFIIPENHIDENTLLVHALQFFDNA